MTAPLEARYRRLLCVYPAAYRRAHGPDMLTTMLADAAPDQRWPRPGDAANLVFHGLRRRLLRAPRGGFFDTGWADACALIGPLAALVLLAARVPMLRPEAEFFFVQAGVLALVAAASLAGLRRSAAVLGWAVLVAEAAPLFRMYDAAPVQVVGGLWRAVLALVAAAALTGAAARSVWSLFGRRRLVTVLVALAALDTIAILGDSTRGALVEGRTYYVFYPGDLLGSGVTSGFSISSASSAQLLLMLAGGGVALIALAVAVLSVPGRIRRRLAVAGAPVVTVVVLVDRGLAGWAVSNANMGHAIPLVPIQWLALALLPLAVFTAGLWWVRRRDETLRLAALGATIDNADPAV